MAEESRPFVRVRFAGEKKDRKPDIKIDQFDAGMGGSIFIDSQNIYRKAITDQIGQWMTKPVVRADDKEDGREWKNTPMLECFS